MNIEQQRAAFEAWFLANNPSWEITPEEKRSGQYIFERANIQVEAYLAALASPEVQALRKDAERLEALIALCGYVEDGSDSVVRIFQDDATREWVVRIGGPMDGAIFHGPSPRAAIDAAMEERKK